MFGIFGFVLLLTTSSLHANGIAPEILLYWGVYYSAIMFTIGLALEYICVCILAHARTSKMYWRAALCTITMNLASTIVGVIFRAPFAVLFSVFTSYIGALLLDSPYGTHPAITALQIFGIYLIYVIINTLIEAPITQYFFPKVSRKRIWIWIFIANCLSMGLLGGLLFVPNFFDNVSRYVDRLFFGPR